MLDEKRKILALIENRAREVCGASLDAYVAEDNRPAHISMFEEIVLQAGFSATWDIAAVDETGYIEALCKYVCEDDLRKQRRRRPDGWDSGYPNIDGYLSQVA